MGRGWCWRGVAGAEITRGCCRALQTRVDIDGRPPDPSSAAKRDDDDDDDDEDVDGFTASERACVTLKLWAMETSVGGEATVWLERGCAGGGERHARASWRRSRSARSMDEASWSETSFGYRC